MEHTKLRLCLGTGMGFDVPTVEQIEKIKAAGFDGVFTGWAAGCPVEAWADAAARVGAVYQSIHAPFGKMAAMWAAGPEGDAAAEELCQCLDDCARVSVPIMVAHAFIGFDQHQPTAVGVQRFRRVAEYAQACGVRLALENTEGEEYLDRLMRELAAIPAVGFCIDTGHEMCYNRSQDMIGRYADRVIATHCNDNLGITAVNGEITWLDDAHLLPFDGIADWKGIVRRLKNSSFDGVLTFELTRDAKPGRTTHTSYASWTFEDYLSHVYTRARCVADLFETVETRRADGGEV